MTVDDQIYEQATSSPPTNEPQQQNEETTAVESDGLLHVGKTLLSPDLPTFDEAFYTWKRDYWANRIREEGIRYMVAPMVDQSELAFRMLMHRHNAHLFFTPMIHARLFLTSLTYRRDAFATIPEDRPLVVQFCANDPDIFLDACRLVEGFCDGVDLNLGCPQMVAKRGNYGCFLQEQPELIAQMVSKVHKHCRLPLSVKIRVFDDVESTINYARIIENCGASMLTVHGRTRIQKGAETGRADWEKIRHVREALNIPVVANGNIQMPGDAERCINETGVVAVMSAEGLLSNPLLFEDRIRPCYEVADEYLDCVEKYKASPGEARSHVFRMCHYALSENIDLRDKLACSFSIASFREITAELRRRFEPQARVEDGLQFLDGTEATLAEQVIKLPAYFAKPYVRLVKAADDPLPEHRSKRREELEKISAETGLSFKQIRRRERRKMDMHKALNRKKIFPPCFKCYQPAGTNCENSACKKCCRYTCIRTADTTCKVHQHVESWVAPRRARYLAECLAKEQLAMNDGAIPVEEIPA